jgi:type I restriction enzyme S subunit
VKEKFVPSAWLEKTGRRLDCGPYLSGAVEAKLLLQALPVEKAELACVTQDLVNAGRIKRLWVTSTDHGVPFLTSTDILNADLRFLSLISRRAVHENPLLTIRESWILVTRAGTIGRMAFARPEMDGMACSEDVLRVIPDPEKIRPGYLYAFLCGRFGLPLVIGGTYGAIIQHIEPQHIANLPVPMAPSRIQDAAHKLVGEAAALRTQASKELRAVIHEIEQAADLPTVESRYDGASPDISIVNAEALGARMDGLFHSGFHRSVLDRLLRLPASRRAIVADFETRVFEPGRFKRINVDDPAHGVPLFGTSDIMRAEPVPGQHIVKRTPGLEELVVSAKTILVPRSGQLAGIIGHAVLPYGDIVGGAVSEDAIRVVGPDAETAGYLFACLSSEYGRRQLKARAFGSSIPHLDVRMIRATIVPRLDDGLLKALGMRAFKVAAARSDAVQKEREARTLVEHWIQRKGTA